MEQMTARRGLQTGQWPWTKGPWTRLAVQTAITPAITLKALFPPSPLTASTLNLLNPNLELTAAYYPLSRMALGYSPLFGLEGNAQGFSV